MEILERFLNLLTELLQFLTQNTNRNKVVRQR
jgi:hypothetical protein